MPSVARITLRPFRLPLRGALRWGRASEMRAMEHLLLEVTLSDGSLGRAEIPPRPTIYGETPETVRAAIAYLEPRLVGVEIEDTAALQQALAALPNHHTARGGLDIALWEARAMARGVRLVDLLPPAKARVRVSYILGIAPLEEMLADARRAYGAGVRVFKVKVGRDLEQDLNRLHRLREAFPDVELYADANETLTPENAARYLEAWAAAGLRYVEEPLPVERVTARRALRRRGILPLIADDACFTLRDLERELELDTFDVLNIKPARTGFTTSLAMLARARAANKRVMVGSQACSSFGAYHAALVAFQAGVDEPSELAFHLKAEGAFLEFPPFREGWLYWTDLEGARFDPEAFARYAV